MNRTTPMRRRSPLRRVKGLLWRRRDPIPLAVRAAVISRAGNACERCGAVVPLELHHRRKRSQGGGHTEANLVALCHGCHSEVEGNPAQATADGWTIQRGKVAA